MPLGHTDEAIAEVKRGLELEPLDLNPERESIADHPLEAGGGQSCVSVFR